MRPQHTPRPRQTAVALCSALAILLSASTAVAGPGGGGPFGLGLVIGEPTGLSAKYWMDKTQAVDFLLAFSLDNDNDFDNDDNDLDRLVFAADYLYHIDVFRPRSVELPLHVGIGGKLTFWDRDRGRYRDDDSEIGIAIRVPLGIDLLLRSVPLEFFLEIVPGLFIIPGTNADIDAGIGVRYYF